MQHNTAISQPLVPDRINLDFNKVKNIALNLYGITINKVKELNGYDDKNYYIDDGEGEGFVLKIINSVDSQKPEIFEAQTLLLIHLGNNGISCPKPIRTRNGKLFELYKLGTRNHIVRLLKYIDGVILQKVPYYCPSLFYEIGQRAASMNNAMKNFQNPAYSTYKSLWLLESVPQVLQFLESIKDQERRRMVETIVNEFTNRILPLSKTLQKGLIHGDINEQNIIFEEKDGVYKFKAIIDYGDCHIGCYLYELAITMTYMIIVAKDIKTGGYVLAGYSSVRNISDFERSLLKLCIAARMCQSLVIGEYTLQRDPANTYVMSTAQNGWHMLEKLWNKSNEELLNVWDNTKTDMEDN